MDAVRFIYNRKR